MGGDAAKSRLDALHRTKPVSLAIFASFAVAGLIAGTSAAAHQVERASAIDEVRADLAREPITIPHHAGQVAISFRPGFGSMRAELAFRGEAARPAHLHVPLSNGSLLNVDFRGRRGVLRSTQPLAKLVDGTLLDISEEEGVHRLILRDAIGATRSPR